MVTQLDPECDDPYDEVEFRSSAFNYLNSFFDHEDFVDYRDEVYTLFIDHEQEHVVIERWEEAVRELEND